MDDYIFEDNPSDHELKRLRLIESACDESSRNLILKCGIKPDMRCMEIGPGAGGILRWMGNQVGPNGIAYGVDKNTKYLSDLKNPPFSVFNGAISEFSQMKAFDIVHARYVLIHNKESMEILKKILHLLKPGGIAAIEEPDFTVKKNVSSKDETTLTKVNRAICKMFTDIELNPAYGSKMLPECRDAGFRIQYSGETSHVCNGGAPIARMMGESAKSLREKYKATQLVNDAEIDDYIKYSNLENFRSYFYTTVSVIAQKP